MNFDAPNIRSLILAIARSRGLPWDSDDVEDFVFCFTGKPPLYTLLTADYADRGDIATAVSKASAAGGHVQEGGLTVADACFLSGRSRRTVQRANLPKNNAGLLDPGAALAWAFGPRRYSDSRKAARVKMWQDIYPGGMIPRKAEKMLSLLTPAELRLVAAGIKTHLRKGVAPEIEEKIVAWCWQVADTVKGIDRVTAFMKIRSSITPIRRLCPQCCNAVGRRPGGGVSGGGGLPGLTDTLSNLTGLDVTDRDAADYIAWRRGSRSESQLSDRAVMLADAIETKMRFSEQLPDMDGPVTEDMETGISLVCPSCGYRWRDDAGNGQDVWKARSAYMKQSGITLDDDVFRQYLTAARAGGKAGRWPMVSVSQADLADSLGISPPSVHELLSRRSVHFDAVFDTVCRLYETMTGLDRLLAYVTPPLWESAVNAFVDTWFTD